MRHRVGRGILLFLLLLSLLSGCAVKPPSAPPPAPQAETSPLLFHFIDVGQGDAALLELPDGKIMLIDAGEDGSALSYLQSQQIERIDYLIATHPHSDHIGGMAEIIDAYPVGEIFMPRTGHTTKTYQRLLETIDRHGLTITEAKAGVVIDLSVVTAEFLSPVSLTGDLNNDSAVLKLTYGETAALFMGDAETEAERAITAPLKSDLIKIGHHGSATSTGADFLAKVAPTYAVISCGQGNRYGHPAAQTLERLESAEVQVFRTDLLGTIHFRSDGKNLTLLTDTGGVQSSGAPAALYVTATGTKYHRAGCRYLRHSCIPFSLSHGHYTPCRVCNPAA